MIIVVTKSSGKVILRKYYLTEADKYKELTDAYCNKDKRAIVVETEAGQTETILCDDIINIIRK